jgi:hypothetical protein
MGKVGRSMVQRRIEIGDQVKNFVLYLAAPPYIWQGKILDIWQGKILEGDMTTIVILLAVWLALNAAVIGIRLHVTDNGSSRAGRYRPR